LDTDCALTRKATTVPASVTSPRPDLRKTEFMVLFLRLQLPRLDKAEGFKKGYDHKYIPLPDRPEESALAYVAETNHIDERLLPYRWYHELVVAGAE
jgi:hypothetical protein